MEFSRRILILINALAISLLLIPSAHAQKNENPPSVAPFKILLIESQGQDFPFVETLHDAFRERILESKPNTQIYTEFLEAVRLGSSVRTPALANLVASYKQLGLDAIVFRGPEAYEFGLGHPNLLPQVSQFASADKPVDLQVGQAVSLSPYLFSPQKSLAEIVRLLNPSEIFLLGSETAGTSASALEVFQSAAAELEIEITITPMFSSNLEDMKSRVAAAPPTTVFLLSPFLFPNNRSLTPRAITRELAQVANAPLFVTHSTLMGTGAIGGSLFSAAASGKALAETVLGVKQSGGTQTLMYDGEALARWGIAPSKLEPGTVLSAPYPPLTKISKVVLLGDMASTRVRTQAIIDGFVTAHRDIDSTVDYVFINSAAAQLDENPESPALKAQLDSIVGYDAVITSWVKELEFMARNFPDKFVINLAPTTERTPNNVINIGQDLPERTLRTAQLALRLPSRSGHAVVLLGDFAENAAIADMLRTQISNAGFRTVELIDALDPSTVMQRLAQLKARDTVFFLPFTYLPDELELKSIQFAQYLAERTSAPIFTMHSAFVGRGAIAGHVFKPTVAGSRALEAIQDLNQSGHPKAVYPASITVVDQQAFESFSGSVANLPAGVELINIPDSMSLEQWFEQNGTALLIALVILTTVSLLYRRERNQRIRFNRLNEQLNRSAETQKEMFAVVGHELRTPVATISMVINDQDQTQADKLSTVKQISENLLSVLEDLRTVVDPNRAKEVQYKTSKPSDVVQRALTPLSHMIRDQGIELLYEHNLPSAQSYNYREQALRQLVTNLVKNATVHSGGTQIRVSLNKISDSDRESLVRLAVEDDGKGIATGQIERMFTPFQRGSENKDGAGLGLYISTELARALGGELNYDHRDGGGSRFSLEFALQKCRA